MKFIKLATELRRATFQIEQGLEIQPFKQALRYAHKRKFPYVIIYGPDEATQSLFGLKNMETGKQANFTKTALLEELARITGAGQVK